MGFQKAIKTLLHQLVEVLYPEVGCLHCGEERQVDNDYGLCTHCMDELEMLRVFPPPIAIRKPLQVDEFAAGHRFSRVIAPFEFGAMPKTLIYAFKRSKKRYLARPLARYMVTALEYANIKSDMCVSVPMFAKRQKQQVFNHADVLAEMVCEQIDIPMVRALTRTRDTTNQKALGKMDRKRNVQGAFELIKDACNVKGKRVLLVDDVLTTGATADVCARVLLRAGATRVDVLCIAITRIKEAPTGPM